MAWCCRRVRQSPGKGRGESARFPRKPGKGPRRDQQSNEERNKVNTEQDTQSSSTELKAIVDTRILKNGMIRLRFRLTEAQAELVDRCVSLVIQKTGYKSRAAALDAVFLDHCSSSPPAEFSIDPEPSGNHRRIFRLYPDQYELIRTGLDNACTRDCPTDADALVFVCGLFLLRAATEKGAWL